ncbi:MAG: type II toxin-antitoxin system HicA family toxin [Gemmatimonas sp.]
MGRLPTVTAREMVAALKRAGFEEDEQRGSHLRMWHPERKFITTVPIHPGDLPRPLVKAILKQSGLSEEEFRDLL